MMMTAPLASSTQVLENMVTNSGSGFEAATVVLSVYAVCTTLTILVLVLVLVYLCFRMRPLATSSKLATPDTGAHRKADLSTDELEMQQNSAYATTSFPNPQQHDDYECLQ